MNSPSTLVSIILSLLFVSCQTVKPPAISPIIPEINKYRIDSIEAELHAVFDSILRNDPSYSFGPRYEVILKTEKVFQSVDNPRLGAKFMGHEIGVAVASGPTYDELFGTRYSAIIENGSTKEFSCVEQYFQLFKPNILKKNVSELTGDVALYILLTLCESLNIDFTLTNHIIERYYLELQPKVVQMLERDIKNLQSSYRQRHKSLRNYYWCKNYLQGLRTYLSPLVDVVFTEVIADNSVVVGELGLRYKGNGLVCLFEHFRHVETVLLNASLALDIDDNLDNLNKSLSSYFSRKVIETRISNQNIAGNVVSQDRFQAEAYLSAITVADLAATFIQLTADHHERVFNVTINATHPEVIDLVYRNYDLEAINPTIYGGSAGDYTKQRGVKTLPASTINGLYKQHSTTVVELEDISGPLDEDTVINAVAMEIAAMLEPFCQSIPNGYAIRFQFKNPL